MTLMDLRKAYGALWLMYLAFLPLSLAGMEVFSTLLLVLTPFCVALDPRLRDACVPRHPMQKVIVACLGLVALSWVASLAVNAGGTVVWSKDLEPIRRLFFIFFPAIALPRGEDEKGVWPTRYVLISLSIGFVLSFVIGYLYRRELWAGDARYSGAMSFAFTYGACASSLFFVLLWSWARTGYDKGWRRAFLPLLIFIFFTLLYAKSRAIILDLYVGLLLIAFLYPHRSFGLRVKGAALALLIVYLCGEFLVFNHRVYVETGDQGDFLKDSPFWSHFSLDYSMRQRLAYGEAGLHMTREYFPWGVGYKNPTRHMPAFAGKIGFPTGPSHCHNQWIESMAGTGVLASLAWLFLFGSLIWSFGKSAVQSRGKDLESSVLLVCVIHLLLLSFFDVIFQDAEMSNVSYFLIGIFYWHFRGRAPSTSSEKIEAPAFVDGKQLLNLT
jgi:O-antigen ligase